MTCTKRGEFYLKFHIFQAESLAPKADGTGFEVFPQSRATIGRQAKAMPAITQKTTPA